MQNQARECFGTCFSTFVVPDVSTEGEPCYVAYHPELAGCMGQGDTPEKATRDLEEATRLYVAVLVEKGLPLPRPDRTTVVWHIMGPALAQAEMDETRSPSMSVGLPVLSPE